MSLCWRGQRKTVDSKRNRSKIMIVSGISSVILLFEFISSFLISIKINSLLP